MYVVKKSGKACEGLCWHFASRMPAALLKADEEEINSFYLPKVEARALFSKMFLQMFHPPIS